MSYRNLTITIVVVIVVLAGLGLWLINSQKSQMPQAETPAAVTTPSEPATEQSSPSGEVTENLVTITSTGFSPNDITVKTGESVTWVNDDSAVHAVNSVVHPTHQVYPPLNLGNIEPGEKQSLSFPDPGTYKYHDHLNPTLAGSVTVE